MYQLMKYVREILHSAEDVMGCRQGRSKEHGWHVC